MGLIPPPVRRACTFLVSNLDLLETPVAVWN
jgi:hypothetical protein